MPPRLHQVKIIKANKTESRKQYMMHIGRIDSTSILPRSNHQKADHFTLPPNPVERTRSL